MTMERTASYFTVGVFVSLALLALVGFLIWLAGAHDFGRYVRYTIYFTDPVSGLADEAVVKYKGVDVGRILRMRLAPEGTDLIKVDIEVREETPVRQSTTAEIEMQGILGASYIELATANADDGPPPRLSAEDYPVLKGQPSRLQQLFEDLPKVVDQLQTTLASIDELSREGTKTAGSIRDFSDNVNKKLDTTLSTFDEFSKESTKTASSLRELSENANKKLQTTLSSIEDFSNESTKTASSLRELSDTANKRLDSALSSIDDFSKEGKRTAASIRGLAEKLKDDPSQVLRPPPAQKGVVIAK
jgi:phospholipid/cholesterol/gamma-HCH transport system substrate-binding protein